MTSGHEGTPFAALGQGLRPLHEVPRLRVYLVEVAAARDFTLALAWSRVKTSSSGTRLGGLWLVLGPLLEGGAYFLVFGLLLQTGRGVENFVAYLVVGIFVFRFVSGTVTSVARSVQANRKLAQTLVHPVLVLPLAESLERLMAFVPAVVMMLAIVWVAPPQEPVGPALVAVVPALLLGWGFAVGTGLVLARLLHGVRDLANVLPFATRLWLFTSAVFYGVDRFPEGSALRQVLEANPAYVVMSLVRSAVLDDVVAGPALWASAAAWATGALVCGFFVFRSGETRYAGG